MTTFQIKKDGATTIFGNNRTEYISNYDTYLPIIGGITTQESGGNDFYVRFGEPNLSNGDDVAVNCLLLKL